MPVAILAMSMMEARLGSSAMRHPWWQSSDGVDLDHAVRHPDRVVGRRHRYREATRHPALPGSNSPVGSSRISKRPHVGRLPTSKYKFANERQRSHTGPRDRIADHDGRARPRRRASPQLKVCNLSFSELSAWRSNTCVEMPLKSAGLPSLSLPLALQFAVP